MKQQVVRCGTGQQTFNQMKRTINAPTCLRRYLDHLTRAFCCPCIRHETIGHFWNTAKNFICFLTTKPIILRITKTRSTPMHFLRILNAKALMSNWTALDFCSANVCEFCLAIELVQSTGYGTRRSQWEVWEPFHCYIRRAAAFRSMGHLMLSH